MRCIVFISAFLSLLLCAPAFAQDAQSSAAAQAEAKAEAQKAREEAELRIEASMVTMTSLVEALSKNLGQLHYLRTLCFGQGDQKWRNYAFQVMSIESRGDAEAERQLVRAFNAGYYQEQQRHSQCSRNVSVDVAALSENGRHIAAMLGDPYRDY